MKNITKYDYDTLVERMTELLKNKPGWGDGFDSSQGQTLIQLMADMTDHLHFMLERRSTENYVSNAKLRSSLIARASGVGYRPKRVVGSTGTIKINLIDENGLPKPALGLIVIPQYTQLTFSGQNFVTTQRTEIQIGESEVFIQVKEGTKQSIQVDGSDITTDLYNSGVIVIPEYENIDENSLIVSSAGDLYQDVKTADSFANRISLTYADSNDLLYDIRYAFEGMRIIFGDNTFGKKPDSIVDVTYVLSSETPVNVTSLNNEFSFESETFTDNLGIVPPNEYYYTAVNTTQITGGKEVESNESIRQNTIDFVKSNGRAVTPQDYEFWIKQSDIGGIVDVKVFGEEEIDTLIYNMNNVYVTYLTQSGEALTVEQQQELRVYMDVLKEATVHLVLMEAQKLFLQVITEIKRDDSLPISQSELFSIVRNFLYDYFKLEEGTIGGGYEHSDIIRDFYNLKLQRNGIEYTVVDFIKLEINAMFPFEYPPRTSIVNVRLNPNYDIEAGAAADDQFILVLQNIPAIVDIESGDSIFDILLKMRDQVMANTPYIAKVQINGIGLDAYGNPIPIDIDPQTGSNILIGVDTPYFSPVTLINNDGEPEGAGMFIGSSLVSVISYSPAIIVHHYYYSSPAGRRPTIPLRFNTGIEFTAPSDTDVNIYLRTVMDDPSTEVPHPTIPVLAAGTTFSETFTTYHSLHLEYVDNSSEDVIVEIDYGEHFSDAVVLNIATPDGFGSFTTQKTSGDLSDFTFVEYLIQLPRKSNIISTDTQNIYPRSLSIVDETDTTVLLDGGDGYFRNLSGGLIPTGSINYINGIVEIPDDLLPAGSYYIKYRQDRFQNYKLVDSAAPVLMDIKQNFGAPETDPEDGYYFSKIILV